MSFLGSVFQYLFQGVHCEDHYTSIFCAVDRLGTFCELEFHLGAGIYNQAWPCNLYSGTDPSVL